ncbi:hypothetical protein V8E36_009513 [Tilletia maclaganii]
MSKAASAAAAAAASAAAAAAAAAREAADEQSKLPPREIDFSTFSDEALHAYVTNFKLAPHFPPRSLLTSAIQSSAIPQTSPTPSDDEDEGASDAEDDDGDDEGVDNDEGDGEGQPPRKRRRRQMRRSESDRNASLISTDHILPTGPTNRRRAAAVAAAAAVTASSLTGAANGGDTEQADAAANGPELEELDPEEAAQLEQLADVHAARTYLSRAVSKHFANLPVPKEGEVVVGFLYRARVRDKVLKIADYTPPPHLA